MCRADILISCLVCCLPVSWRVSTGLTPLSLVTFDCPSKVPRDLLSVSERREKESELPWGTMSLHIFSISSTWARRGWRTPSSRLILVKRGFLRFRETFRSSLPVVLVFILPASRRDNITSNSEIYKMLLRSVSADSTEEGIFQICQPIGVDGGV